MAYAQTDFARSGQFGLKARFQQFRDLRARRAAERAVYRQTLRELQALDNRDLADLGIHRSEIPRIAAEAAGRA